MAKLLIVDDDLNLLSGIKRHFRKRFDLLAANSGQEALDLVKQHPDIGVVVSDMRMPGLSGLDTLKAIKVINPDVVRIMLTGNADQQTAVDAVNQGAIFRFFNKPCDNETLAMGVQEAFRQHEMITAEKVLLEKTLAGTVKFLLDLLSFSNPEAFARSGRIRGWCKQLIEPFGLQNAWRLDFAAMLLPLADLIVPQDVLQKRQRGEALSEDEESSLKEAPKTIKNMLKQIPRLEEISEIVAYAYASKSEIGDAQIPLEAKILRILTDLSKRTAKMAPAEKSFKALVANIREYDEAVFKKIHEVMLKDQKDTIGTFETVTIGLALLRPGQTLLSDVMSEDDRMLLSHGCILTQTHIEKLKAIAKSIGISKEITVARPIQI